MSLRQKLLLFLIPGMLLLFGGLYYAVSIVVEHEERGTTATYAQKHLLVILGLQKERSIYLGDKTEHIASLPIFKAALAERDPEQIKTVTDNLLKLPDSALMMVSDANGQTLYQQDRDVSIQLDAKDFPTIACAINNKHACRNILRIGKNVFNVTSTPVSSGSKLWGVLTTGYIYSDLFLKQLKESTEYCEITFVDSQCSILASTLPKRDLKAVRNQCLQSGLEGLSSYGDDMSSHDLGLGKYEYISISGAISDSNNNDVAYLIVHQSLEGMEGILEQVHKYFLLVGGVLLILLLIGDLLVVRGIVKPIEELEIAAGKINVGDSKLEMEEVTTSREAKHLQHAINGMLDDINRKTQTLRYSEIKYRQMIDHSQEAIISTDHAMNIIIWNAAAETIFGYSESEMLGKQVNTIIPDCYHEEHHLMSDAPSNCDMLYNKARLRRGIHKSGGEVPIEISLSNSKDKDGNLIFTTFIKDISSDLEAEAQQRMLINAIEQSTDMIVITDTKAIILYANPAFGATTGHVVDEIIGKSTKILQSGEQPSAFYQELWDTISAGNVWKGTLINKRKNGERYPEEMTISPVIDATGTIQQYIAIKRDISQQQKLKAQVEHTQRLEGLGVLAGGIAHDFNNILSAIMGNASLAERKMDADAPAKRHIETIITSSERAANLCRQMLAYSGKGTFVIKPIDLSVLVEDMSKLLEVSISKNILIDYHLKQHLPAIDADEAQIQQVVMNLITNASEAIGSDNGIISITTDVMRTDEAYMADVCLGTEAKPGDCVYLEVSDNGCGMDTVTKNKIFDPFFTTKFTGRGLGMSAVLGIIRGHKGSMKLLSQPGKGTNFNITFPMLEAPTIEEPENRQEQDIKGSGTILIVDDEEMLREVAEAILSDSGFNTLIACDGQEGLDIYKRYAADIDCVLLDMTMPRMNGEEACHAIRAINPNVKIILCSGYSEEDATNSFTDMTLNGFIQKPYMPNTLIDKIHDVLNT